MQENSVKPTTTKIDPSHRLRCFELAKNVAKQYKAKAFIVGEGSYDERVDVVLSKNIVAEEFHPFLGTFTYLGQRHVAVFQLALAIFHEPTENGKYLLPTMDLVDREPKEVDLGLDENKLMLITVQHMPIMRSYDQQLLERKLWSRFGKIKKHLETTL